MSEAVQDSRAERKKIVWFRFGKTDDGEWETAYSGEIDIIVK